MHNHNDKNKQDRSMMWMMVVCCALPIALLVFVFGGGAALFSFSGGGGLWSWPLLAFIGVVIAGHLWMMFRGHGSRSGGHESHDNGTASKTGDIQSPETEKKDHSCCH